MTRGPAAAFGPPAMPDTPMPLIPTLPAGLLDALHGVLGSRGVVTDPLDLEPEPPVGLRRGRDFGAFFG